MPRGSFLFRRKRRAMSHAGQSRRREQVRKQDASHGITLWLAFFVVVTSDRMYSFERLDGFE
jgi:hypothetical protein